MFGKIVYSIAISLALASPVPAQYQAEDCVIDINDGEILVSADDFYRHLEGAANSSDGEVDLSTFDRALEFSEDIIKARVIVTEAKKRGYPDDETASSIRKMINNVVKKAAANRINEMIEVPEEKINEFYTKMDERVKVAIIMTQTEETSREVYDKLEGGADFGDLAAEYNIDEKLRETRGVIDNPIGFSFDPTLAQVFNLPEPYAYTEPMKLPYGNWLIVQLIERVDVFSEENPKPELDEVRDMIAGSYVNSVSDEFTKNFLAGEIPENIIEIDDDLYEKGLTWPPSEILDKLNGKGLAVASINEEQVLFDDWLKQSGIVNLSDEEWNNLRNDPLGDMIKSTLESSFDRRLVQIELIAWGKMQNIQDEPDPAWDIWRKSSDYILDNFTKEELIPLLPHPGDEEVLEYYEANKGDYIEKEILTGRLYIFDTEEEADKYRGIADEYIPETNIAPDILIEKICEDYGIDPADPDQLGHILAIYTTYKLSREPEYEEKFNSEISEELKADILKTVFDLDEHVYSDVYQLTDGRYAFFWNKYYIPFRQKEFDEVKDSIYRELDNVKTASSEADAIVVDWITEITSQYDYTIHEDVAKAVYEKWEADNATE